MNGVIWGTKDLHRTWEQRILRDALYNRITTLELGFEKKKKPWKPRLLLKIYERR